MSKQLNKSYVFFKNLYRSGEITPPKDKQLTIVHKAIVSYILKNRKIKDVPNTIGYFEWDHVKSKLKFRWSVASWIITSVFVYYIVVVPIMKYNERWMEKAEIKKYGESRQDDRTFSRYF